MKTPLTPQEADRVFDLVAEAEALEPEQRAAFLAQACLGADGLRAEVESLLGFKTRAPHFLASPAFQRGVELLGFSAEDDLKPGDTLGDYRVVSLLGSGGMGEVYLADDAVHGRQVALKLIGQGRAEEVRGRHFRHERKVLATLNHPHIARLYGSGVTAKGQAYLVMEYVEGERLDRYCQDRGLDVTARLALFRKVCAAVSYAHQNLVVHRDLKPANIRVTLEGEPKLLDFGIAKLLDPEGTTSRVDPTVTMQGAMTPDYASPEQIKGEAITTASDVYSLGVVLFELLTGQRPYAHLKSRRPDELARAICEEEPPRPSTVATHTAPTTATRTVPAGQVPVFREPAGKLRRRLEGDLDNIVAKVLRKETARRYPSVLALSEDIRRHGEGLPVTARKDTLGYRAGKFVRRNKVGVAAAALVLLALLGGLAATTWQAHAAKQERDRAQLARTQAESAQRQAERINEFLQKLLGSASPMKLGKDVKVVDVLAATSKNIDTELANEPEVLAQVELTLGRTYSQLELYEVAMQHSRAAFNLLQRLHGDDNPATMRAAAQLGDSLSKRSRFAEAEPLLRQALAWQERQTPADAASKHYVLVALAYLLGQTGQTQEAETKLAEAWAQVLQVFGENSLEAVQLANITGTVKRHEGDLPGAAVAFRSAIERCDRIAPNSYLSLTPQFNLCNILFDLGRLPELQQAVQRLERDTRQIVGENNAAYARVMSILMLTNFGGGDYAQAVPVTRRVLEVMGATYPPDSLNMVQTRAILGLSLTRTGHASEGEPFLRLAYDNGKKIDRVEFIQTIGNLETALGECLLAQKRYVEAEPLLLTGHDDLEKRLGAQNRLTIQATHRLQDLYLAWNKPAEAARFADNVSAQPSPTP